MNLHPKAAGAGMAGALSVIVMWGLSFAVVVPPEVGAALASVRAFTGAWLAPWFQSIRPGPEQP